VATVLIAPLGAQNPGQSEVQRGFAIAPVALNLKGLNRSLVGQGSYYANGISVCAGCHSGANGHMSGGNPFGPVVSRNLTPDANGLPNGLTLQQFTQVLRFGTDFKALPPRGTNAVLMSMSSLPAPRPASCPSGPCEAPSSAAVLVTMTNVVSAASHTARGDDAHVPPMATSSGCFAGKRS
jgi:hypothetical protein